MLYKEKFAVCSESHVKFLPITGHEGPEGE